MPLYEYVCQQCDCRYERLERASEPKDGTCPECGGTSHRLIGAPALQFKGSGWYVNDYGKGNGNSNESRPTEKETDTATKAADSTPSPKPESKKTEKKADAKVA
jgi:putative FmdB family regulatory protein